ncbi:MAG TPA: hypothetical protein VH352_26980 [Pseudonocardiaceae bacterium]|nr:hypothetical protein [Pseudonocardiaceae bacterium]
MAFPTVSISLSDADDQLRQLAGWLRDEDELRGRVRLVGPPIAPDQLGGVLDAVEVVLTSGSADDAQTVIASIDKILNNNG